MTKPKIGTEDEVSKSSILPAVQVTSGSAIISALDCLPFPLLSLEWYRHQGQLSGSNISRDHARLENKPQTVDGNLLCLSRSKVKGTLQDNIQQLHSNKASGPMTKLMISLANYIANSGPLITTRELIDKYYKLKQVSTAPLTPINPGTFYDTISKYLNVIQMVVHISVKVRNAILRS